MHKIQTILNWAKTIFSYNRSITGSGVRKTLNFFKKINPQMRILSFRSGMKCFDWKVPDEWEINNAFFVDLKSKKKFSDFKKNNLSVLNYSIPVNKTVKLSELKKHIFTLPKQPNLIPYVTSYYKKNWGFCLNYHEFKKLKNSKYKVFIDSKFKKGNMNYGELYLKGKSKKEIFFSTNICHPSMANNELSGPLLANYLYKSLKDLKYKTNLSYRFLFIPETIGSIAYLSKNYKKLKKNMFAGFVLSCVGDNRNFSHIESRYGDTLADKALIAAFINLKNSKKYSFLERGSDERQYCYPGIDLPVAGFCRTKYGNFKEYHTSGDNLKIINKKGFEGSYKVLRNIIDAFELGIFPINKIKCEPQLSKRNLYLSTSDKKNYYDKVVNRRLNLLAYSDGKKNIFEISKTLDEPLEEIIYELKLLKKNGLLEFK
jgi:aminopeptidase-like protein